MIIIKYLIREILKVQITIFLILLLVFFCQKLVKMLNAAVVGEIPTNLILFLLILGIPEMTQLILPLSLFLGMLIKLGKLYTGNEIIVMHACGLERIVLLQITMVLVLFTSIISSINVMWLGPLLSSYQSKILAEAKINPSTIMLITKQFQKIKNENSIFFVENVHDNFFYYIFLAQSHNKNIIPSIIIAKSGQLVQKGDRDWIFILNDGIHLKQVIAPHGFFITSFKNYQSIISYQELKLNFCDVGQMNIVKLWNIKDNHARVELHWRLTLIFITIIMAMIVLPLSEVNSYQNHILRMLLPILLYFIFLLLQISVKSNGMKNEFNWEFWMWFINGCYMLIAMYLNLQDTVFSRRIRSFIKKNVVISD